MFFCFLGQCEAHGIPLPTLDEVDSKATQFNEARHYMYNEDDVDKVCEKWKPGFVQISIRDYILSWPSHSSDIFYFAMKTQHTVDVLLIFLPLNIT